MQGRHVARGMRVIALALPLLLVACGSSAPPPAVSPTASTLGAAPAKAGRPPSPWPNSRFFTPRPATPAPLFSRPKRPIRGPAVHTLRS